MKRRACPRRGFTLIEILVALAIVGVLAALGLSAFSGVRESGRQTVCTSNLHQSSLAIRMYLDDAHGPPPQMQSVWDGGYIRDAEILACPDDPEGNWGGSLYEAHDRKPSAPPESLRYSYNAPFGLGEMLRIRRLLEADGGNPGILTCQRHGQSTFPMVKSLPRLGDKVTSHLDIQGLTLRARLDGSVQRVRIAWPIAPGGVHGRPWPLFSDSAEPSP